jgi:hypothetical protein
VSAAYDYTPHKEYGVKAGCGFARDDKCLEPGNPPSIGTTVRTVRKGVTASDGESTQVLPHFCNGEGPGGPRCSMDRSFYGGCNIQTVNVALETHEQYWTNDAKKAGDLMQADYCPRVSYNPIYACGIPGNNEGFSAGVSRENYGTRFHSTNSMCMTGTLLKKPFANQNRERAGCYVYKCNKVGNAWTIDVSVSDPQNIDDRSLDKTATCTSSSQQLTFPDSYSGHIDCVDPAIYCAAPEKTKSFRVASDVTPSPAPAPSATPTAAAHKEPTPAAASPSSAATPTPSASPKPVGCVVSADAVTSECSKKCGDGGVFFTTRTVEVLPQHGGAACPPPSELLVRAPCPVDTAADLPALPQDPATRRTLRAALLSSAESAPPEGRAP